MGHNGFGVDIGALEKAETGVRDAVAELGDMAGEGASLAGGVGGFLGKAAIGRQGGGLAEGLLASAGDFGHDRLGGMVVLFGEKWSYAVSQMVQDGYAAADALGEARTAYQAADAEAQQKLIDSMRAQER
jgi:hypothetical protein